MPEQPFSETLKQSVADLWRRAHHDHPFVTGIGDGTLSLERFRYYMRQDYLFLIDYCRVLALATARSRDVESMGRWAKLLDETLNSEMELHRQFCADFGITEEQLEASAPSPATVAYTGHLRETAERAEIEEISAALLPCQWGYDEIGRTLAANLTAPAGSLHARWVAGYNSPEYRNVTTWLRRLVDRLAESATEDVRTRMLSVFADSTRYELRFWEAAWRLE